MSRIKGYPIIIFSGILYGSIPIFATLLGRQQVSSMEQIFVRLVISALLFLVYFALAGKSLRLSAGAVGHFIWFGLVGIALLFTLYVSAAIMTSVTVTVLLLYTQPVYTLIIARLFFKQRITLYGIAAIVMALAGVAVIFRIWEISWASFGLGHIFGLLSGLCYAIYIAFVRTFSPRYGSAVVTFWSFVIGLLWMIPLWFAMDTAFGLPAITSINLNLSHQSWLLLIGFALIPTLLAYLLFNYGLKSVESHRAGVLILSEPLAAILMGAVILGQNLQLTDLLGGILIVFSFLLVKKQEN